LHVKKKKTFFLMLFKKKYHLLFRRNVKYNGSKALDIYYLNENNNSNVSKRPVVIYIYGGIWFLGMQ